MMIPYVRQHIEGLLQTLDIHECALALPPRPGMGDVAFPVFQYAKIHDMSPIDAAHELVDKITVVDDALIDRVEAYGPYVNFFLNDTELARVVMNLSHHTPLHPPTSRGKIMIEFGCPNTHKALHIGHLRNLILGESLVRLHEHAGYEVVRVNYQGDVGMHIAKCLWGIEQLRDEYEAVKDKSTKERVVFLGRAYAYAAQAFEKDTSVASEVVKYNEMIYEKHEAIIDVYDTTRSWSLEYFESIYQLLNTRFDRYYFESEMVSRAVNIVREQVVSEVLVQSDGAVIFKGSDHGLHDRVFLNTAGFPTYEAKDMALAEKQFAEYNPLAVYHIIGPEQTEYLKVLFKALEIVFPETTSKEHHIPYGYVSLADGKMSSRAGNVVLAEDVLIDARTHIAKHMDNSEIKKDMTDVEKQQVIEQVAIASVKYAFLKTGRTNDISFDVQESVSTAGDSGPYILYSIARFDRILAKSTDEPHTHAYTIPAVLEPAERAVIMTLGSFGDALESAVDTRDPALVARHLFELAQVSNRLYHDCPILDAPPPIRAFRLELIRQVRDTMEHGLSLLAIPTVAYM